MGSTSDFTSVASWNRWCALFTSQMNLLGRIFLRQKLSTSKVDNIQHSKRQSSPVDDAYKSEVTSKFGSYFYTARDLYDKKDSPFHLTILTPPNTTSILFQIHRYWVGLISLTDELCTYILYDLYSCIYSPLTHCRFFQNYLWSEQEVGMSVSNGGLCFFLSYQEQIVVDVTLTMPLASCLVFPNAVPPGTHMRLRKMKRGQSIRTH